MIKVNKNWTYNIVTGKDGHKYILVCDGDKVVTNTKYIEGQNMKDLISKIAAPISFNVPRVGDYRGIEETLEEKVVQPHVRLFVFYCHEMAHAQMIEDPAVREATIKRSEGILSHFDDFDKKVSQYFDQYPQYYYNYIDSSFNRTHGQSYPYTATILAPSYERYGGGELTFDAEILMEDGDRYHYFHGYNSDFEKQN